MLNEIKPYLSRGPGPSVVGKPCAIWFGKPVRSVPENCSIRSRVGRPVHGNCRIDQLLSCAKLGAFYAISPNEISESANLSFSLLGVVDIGASDATDRTCTTAMFLATVPTEKNRTCRCRIGRSLTRAVGTREIGCQPFFCTLEKKLARPARDGRGP